MSIIKLLQGKGKGKGKKECCKIVIQEIDSSIISSENQTDETSDCCDATKAEEKKCC